MAVPSTGAISLNDFHVEAGGSNNSQCSLNDADIRDLIDKSSGATMSFNEWYGASGILWEVTLTNGETGNKNDQVRGFIQNGGYPSAGSLSDTTIDFANGATCGGIYWVNANSGLLFFDSGANTTQNSFTTMKIGSATFNQSDAGFDTSTGSGMYSWGGGITNPMPASVGGTTTVVFE
tara:strand:- start:1760 stop:2293 length:534 start_codon:yes stop_codon:yes gene_type:complete